MTPSISTKAISALLSQLRDTEYNLEHFNALVKYGKRSILGASIGDREQLTRIKQMHLAEVTELYRLMQEKYKEVAGEAMK